MFHFFSATSPRPRRFGCLSIFLTLLTFFLLGAAVLIWLAKSEPAGYREANEMIESMTDAEKGQRADAFFNALANTAQGIDAGKVAVRPGVRVAADSRRVYERDLSVSVVDANIWLATRLEALLANQNAKMPAAMSDPRVWIDDGQIVLSARVDLPGLKGVVSMNLSARMTDEGKLAAKIERVRTGKVSVPVGATGLADKLRNELRQAQDKVLQQLANIFEGVEIDPVWPESGNKARQVRVLKFDIQPDRIDLRLRHEPAQ